MMKADYSIKLLLSFILTIFLLSACGNSSSNVIDEFRQIKYDKTKPLSVFMDDIKKHYQLPGLAVAVIQNSKIVNAVVSGTNKSINGTQLDINSKFQIGSCGKSFTSLLSGILIIEGKINWNTKIGDVFPNWKNDFHNQYNDITLLELLSHTAGIREFTSDQEFFNLSNIVPNLIGSLTDQRKHFAYWVLQQSPVGSVGEFSYSNAGYAIAAAMLEEVTGNTYEQLVKDKIFTPLKLNSAVFGYPFEKEESQPWRHFRRSFDGVGIPLAKNEKIINGLFNPAGNISISIVDFAKYLILHSQAIKNNETIFPSKMVQKLHTPIVSREDDMYAMGWAIRELGNQKVSTHSGSDQSIFAMMSIDQKSGKGLTVATNIGGQRAELALVNITLEILH